AHAAAPPFHPAHRPRQVGRDGPGHSRARTGCRFPGAVLDPGAQHRRVPRRADGRGLRTPGPLAHRLDRRRGAEHAAGPVGSGPGRRRDDRLCGHRGPLLRVLTPDSETTQPIPVRIRRANVPGRVAQPACPPSKGNTALRGSRSAISSWRDCGNARSRMVLTTATGRFSSCSHPVELNRATSEITVRWVATGVDESSRNAQAWGRVAPSSYSTVSWISAATASGTALSRGLARVNPPIVTFSTALRSAPVPVAANTRPAKRDGSRRAASWETIPPIE